MFKSNIKYYILPFLDLIIVIYLSSSFYLLSIRGTVYLLILLIYSFLRFMVLFFAKNIKFSFIKTIFLLIVLTLTIFTFLYNSEASFYDYTILWIIIISSYLLSHNNYNKLLRQIVQYVGIFISGFALISFMFYLIIPVETFSLFFQVTRNKTGFDVYNLLFSVLPVIPLFRNFGLFWEPSAFGIYLLFFLFFELFSNNLNLKVLLLYVISIFSTLSTTAYIGLFMIMGLFFIRTVFRSKLSSNQRFLLLSFFISIPIVFLIYYFLPSSYQFILFGKLEIFFDELQFNPAFISTLERLKSIQTLFLQMVLNPLFGLGYREFYLLPFNNSYTMNISTFFNLGALFGVFFPILISTSFYLALNKIFKNGVFSFLSLLVFIILLSTLDFHRNVSLYFLFFCSINFLSKKSPGFLYYN